MKFISLFTGKGGMDLGFEWAGMECVAQVEINDYCQKLLAKRWPDVPRFRDIKDVKGSDLPPADLICGGFPCQPFSFAGKREGSADDRHLWPEYLRLIKEIRPRWVVGENVPGIINTELDTVLSDLESEGYTTGALNIPACAFDAHHIRQRIFILAYSDGTRGRGSSGNTFHKRGGASKGGPASIPQGERWGDDAAKCDVKSAGQNVSNAYSHQQYGWGGVGQVGGQWIKKEISQAGEPGRAKWSAEPGVGRVAYGVPNRVDRLRGLGNAVVPQVAQFIAHNIMQVEAQLNAVRSNNHD